MYLFIGVPHKFGFEKTAENAKAGDIVTKGEPESDLKPDLTWNPPEPKPKFNQEEASKEDIAVYKNQQVKFL